ncbi:MAG: sugar transferase [Bacillota bacterium]
MFLKKWEDLPECLKNKEVKLYYEILKKKKFSLFFKRLFDMVVSGFVLILVSPIFLILAITIKIDSKGPVFYRQIRVTQYGKEFRIFKFRSMVSNADKGLLITVNNDNRVTRVGKIIRKFKLDEFSQLIDVFRGAMSFIGTRPEVPKYVEKYTPEMMATLLLPAGVSSLASIYFKDEAAMLKETTDVDEVYVNKVLPIKMKYNLKAVEKFSFANEIKLMFMTIFSVLDVKYNKINYGVEVNESNVIQEIVITDLEDKSLGKNSDSN